MAAKGLEEPPRKSVNGRRPQIDWDTLLKQWILSGMDRDPFLAKFGLHAEQAYVKKGIKLWPKVDEEHRTVRQIMKPHIEEVAEVWSLVRGHRKKQAISDFETAEALRNHVKLILTKAVAVGENGETITKLKPADCANLARTLIDIQRVQRLALGMSTENVGVDRPDDGSHVETGDDEMGVPIFEVQISDNGKFKRARPILINGGK